MATPRAAPKRSGSSRGKWFFTGVLPIHETIPLQILDPFRALDVVGHTVSTRRSNAQVLARISESSVRRLPTRCVMLLTESPGPLSKRRAAWGRDRLKSVTDP